MPIRQTSDDACPGALRLHAAADGPLARVRLPGGMLTGRQLGVLADLAAEYGDGALELTSRANVQLRALRADPAELAERLSGAGLLPSLAHETVRNIAAPPLADAGTRDLVEALDRALCADDVLAGLPGRFLFAVGRTALAADVAAVPAGSGWAVVLGGTDVGVRVPAGRVVATMLAAAHGFLAERAGREPRPWRLREIPDGARLVAARLPGGRPGGGRPTGDPTTGDPTTGDQTISAPATGDPTAGDPATGAPATGAPATVPLTGSGSAGAPIAGGAPDGETGPLLGELGGGAVGVLVPLGRLTRVHLRVLAQADRLAVAPGGAMVVFGLPPEALPAAGLVTERDSKWVGVTTCAGRPGCAKALADVRQDADRAARFVAGQPVHWVGCERGCGSPAGRHVRVEATGDGYRVDGEAVRGDLGEVVAARRA